jgi:hypothetical protein
LRGARFENGCRCSEISSATKWQPEAVETLARADAARQSAFAEQLVAKLARLRAAGVLFDFNELDPRSHRNSPRSFTRWPTALHAAKLELWLAVRWMTRSRPTDLDALAHSRIASSRCFFDEHTEGDAPGPVASQDWCEGWLSVISEYGAAGQWIAALGAHSYDWNTTTGELDNISFRDAMSRASYAGADTMAAFVVEGAELQRALRLRRRSRRPRGVVSRCGELLRSAPRGARGGARRRGRKPARHGRPGAVARARAHDAGGRCVSHMARPMKTDQTVTHVGRGEVVS